MPNQQYAGGGEQAHGDVEGVPGAAGAEQATDHRAEAEPDDA